MADAAVSFVVGKLGALIAQNAIFLYSVKEELMWLQRELEGMKGFLKDAECKQRRGDERVKHWVHQIKEVAYQVENVVDAVMHETQNWRERTISSSAAGFISRVVYSLGDMTFLYKAGREIENIKSRITQMSLQRVTLGIADLGEDGDDWSALDDILQAQRRLYPHFDDETEVVGFESEKLEITGHLINPEVNRRSVISLVGMGGLGKTTLARRVYNSDEVKQHFDTFAWINVSQKYVVIGLLKDIAKQVMGIGEEHCCIPSELAFGGEALGQVEFSMEDHSVTKGKRSREITMAELLRMEDREVRQKLFDYLKKRRYLIVMDDVWDTHLWNQMHEVFPNVSNGSRMLITTRDLRVGLSADPLSPPHELRLLNDEESWDLFRRRAFPTEELEVVGRQIAKRCGGLPLALQVMGGFLLTKDQSCAAWMEVAESMDWESASESKRCLDILALSYHALPHHHLKSCFLYIASFPEDYEISTFRLIKLWIAEGFVPQRPRQGLEETARGYLDELVRRCLIQVTERNSVRSWACRIRLHDLVRDMCMLEARKDGLLDVRNAHTDVLPACRMAVPRMALHGHSSHQLSALLPMLHSLLCFNLATEQSLAGFGSLRVVDVEGATWLKELPEGIGGMIHLRYLGLRKTGISELPSSLRSLRNLQTLDAGRTAISVLSTREFRSLRHLHLGHKNHPEVAHLPTDACFSNLRTLKYAKASPAWLGRVAKLSNVTNLQKLGLGGISVSADDHKVTLLKFLGRLHHLYSLCLCAAWGEVIPVEVLSVFRNHHHLRFLTLLGALSVQSLPDSACLLPRNLAKFELCETRLVEDPMPTLEKLPNLVKLKFLRQSYAGRSMLCSTGGFPRLQRLEFVGLLEFREWRVEPGAMPSLTHLAIKSNPNLEMLPEGLQNVITLKELNLRGMPQKFVDRVRRGKGQDWHKVRHIPSILVD